MIFRSLCILSSLFIFYSVVSSQTLDEVFATAKKEHKIAMIVVRSEKCAQCNEVADQGLASELTKRLINTSAVLIKLDKLPGDFGNAFSIYSVPPNFFGVIYADGDRNVLRTYNGSSSFYKPYLDNLEKAIMEQDSQDGTLSQLVKEYYGSKTNFEKSYQLVEKIVRVGLEPKDELLDEMVRKAPEDSAVSISFIQFIEKAAPGLGSSAYSYAMKNYDNYNMAWYRMPLSERSNINERIYEKSIRKAIETKDMNFAYSVSNFRRSTYQSSGFQVMQRVSQSVMLQYFKGIKDTAGYLSNAVRYYDMFFMTINVDSILQIDSVKRMGLFKPPANMQPPVEGNRGMPAQVVISFSPAAQFYTNNLNEGAFTFYMYTKNPVYINKALAWSKRSIEFMETPEAMDTYARLLYVTGNKSAAIDWETKAIKIKKVRQFSTKEYQKVLDAMKANLEKIDEY